MVKKLMANVRTKKVEEIVINVKTRMIEEMMKRKVKDKMTKKKKKNGES